MTSMQVCMIALLVGVAFVDSTVETVVTPVLSAAVAPVLPVATPLPVAPVLSAAVAPVLPVATPLPGMIGVIVPAPVPVDPEGSKSKLVLMLLEMFYLGICGIDRCFLGNVCLGTVKGLTLGGCGVWALIDIWVLAVNSVQEETNVDTLNMKATFKADSIHPAYIIGWMVIACQVLHCLCGGAFGHNKAKGGDEEVGSEAEGTQ